MKNLHIIFITFFIFCNCKGENSKPISFAVNENNTDFKKLALNDSLEFNIRLNYAAQSIIDPTIVYDPTYQKINYPNGDVSSSTGVCTDVVIRSYRVLGIDLQKLVHNDMKANFDLYPSKKLWGLKSTDTNIDHRRVPNLQMFFKRQGEEIALSKQDVSSFQPGDIIAWRLPNGLLHIGIVIDKKRQNRPLVVHNIGRGQVAEDVLFSWDIIGHYRYPTKK